MLNDNNNTLLAVRAYTYGSLVRYVQISQSERVSESTTDRCQKKVLKKATVHLIKSYTEDLVVQ